MGVLSRYRDWRDARDPARVLQLKGMGEPISDEVVRECRLYARPLLRRTKALDTALREAAEDYGDLGIGEDVETIMEKLADLQNFILFNHELDALFSPGDPTKRLPDHVENGLEQDGRTVGEAIKGVRKVHTTIEATTHKFHNGQLMVHTSTMFAAIVVGAALAAKMPTQHIRLCTGCATLFVAKHPRAVTCSPRCRQRKRG
jgi:transposase